MPTIFISASDEIASATSVILYEGILGIKISPPRWISIHSKPYQRLPEGKC